MAIQVSTEKQKAQANEPVKDWMNPINRLALIKAVKNRDKVVRIGKRLFRINYDYRPGKIWVQPAEGEFVPCGWFDVKNVTSNQFVQDGR